MKSLHECLVYSLCESADMEFRNTLIKAATEPANEAIVRDLDQLFKSHNLDLNGFEWRIRRPMKDMEVIDYGPVDSYDYVICIITSQEEEPYVRLFRKNTYIPSTMDKVFGDWKEANKWRKEVAKLAGEPLFRDECIIFK